MKRYLGVDLHRTQFTVCTRLENGRTYLRQWPIGELKLFAAQLRDDDELAVESTGNTRCKNLEFQLDGSATLPFEGFSPTISHFCTGSGAFPDSCPFSILAQEQVPEAEFY